ncbi:putative peptidylprolyl isomerase [Rosa chinensis]|uniref:Putative peptidylprolyl isomerase n=1 Tax=Rosa chinensis TaxID=74649 RepID=A0A2P6RBV1_ROSCH|nr:putative peptidylprolyl isomerase [Rosa chinensis]
MKIVAGSLMKAVIRPGGGDSTPEDGDQVIYHCIVRTLDGVIVESSRSEFSAFYYGESAVRLVMGKLVWLSWGIGAIKQQNEVP